MTGVDDVLRKVREAGGRVTPTKRAVVSIVATGLDEHLTADDIAEAVVRQLPDTHLSTIYRILNELETLGVIRHVHLGHGPSTYHLAEDRHHHGVCDECGAVIELPADLFDAVEARLRDHHGFVLRTLHFALAGRCAECLGRSD